jgi:hypothetical protein
MNTLTLGWAGTEKERAIEFDFHVSCRHYNQADIGGKGIMSIILFILVALSCLSYQYRHISTAYHVAMQTFTDRVELQVTSTGTNYFVLPTDNCTFPWNITYIKYSCFRTFIIAEDVCTLHTFQLILFLIRIHTAAISFCRWRVKWHPVDAFLISRNWVS